MADEFSVRWFAYGGLVGLYLEFASGHGSHVVHTGFLGHGSQRDLCMCNRRASACVLRLKGG
jgi:hypothetical protein